VLEIDSKAGEVVIRDTVLIVLGFIVGSNSGESADRFFGCLEVQKFRKDVVIKKLSTRRGGTPLKNIGSEEEHYGLIGFLRITQ
jgi:hypothetical protein